MRDALREVMVAAEGAGRLEGSGVRTGRAEHPVCGDEIEVDLVVEGGALAGYAWRAAGCPATSAVAAAASEPFARRPPIDGLEAALIERLGRLGGLAAHERHAQKLLLRAVADALGAAGP